MKPVPPPGYKTTKPLLGPIKRMLVDLGGQDACIQLQELAIEHLANSAAATNAPAGVFLAPLFKQNGVPHGTYDFVELRHLVSKSYLVLTYAMLEKMLREVIIEYRGANPAVAAVWQCKNAVGENLSPLLELAENLPKADKAKLKACPEFALFEYYRMIRVSSSHLKGSTSAKANKAYGNFTKTDRSHFHTCYMLTAPNAPDKLSFVDFRLFTRAIKYYSNIINEACA